MPDVTGNPEVAGNSVVEAAVDRLPAMVTKVAAVECLGVIDRVLVIVGDGSRIGELATVMNTGGLDVVGAVCVRIVVDSESVTDLNALTMKTDESVRDFKVVEGLTVCMADCMIDSDPLVCDKIVALGCAVCMLAV